MNDYLHKTAGMKQTQFVNMAPLITSSSGSITNINTAKPTVCRVSIMNTNKKSLDGGFFQDLKKHIRNERNRVPTSGTMNAISKHHVHATRSSVGKFTINCLSLPEMTYNMNYYNYI